MVSNAFRRLELNKQLNTASELALRYPGREFFEFALEGGTVANVKMIFLPANKVQRRFWLLWALTNRLLIQNPHLMRSSAETDETLKRWYAEGRQEARRWRKAYREFKNRVEIFEKSKEQL